MKKTTYVCDKCGKVLDENLYKVTLELCYINGSGLLRGRKERRTEPVTQHYCRNCAEELFINKQ